MLTVGIASGDLSSSAQLLASLQQTGTVKSIKQWAIPAEKLPDSAELLPDIIFLDLGRDPDPYFAFGAQLRRIRPTVKVVACSSSVPPNHQLLLEAMRSGVQDFLPKPVNPEALREMLARFIHDMGIKDQSSLEKLIVVMGAKGGVGTTTVAVNLGVQLSTLRKKKRGATRFRAPVRQRPLVAGSSSEIQRSRRGGQHGPP